MSHVKMMAAAQPFISGAISKTVNLPESVTVDDIADIYTQGWKLGLKALAIYRDGSKTAQALKTEGGTKPADEAEAAAALEPARPVRRRMPRERQSLTHKFSIAGHEGYITAGGYGDGTGGEVLLTDVGHGGHTNGGNGHSGPSADASTPKPAASALTDEPPAIPAKLQGLELGPACSMCGGMMQRTGSCYTCSSCGNNTGCG